MNKLINLKKILDILDYRHRILFSILFILFVISALIEAVSIGIILPLIYILIDQNSEIYILIKSLYNIFFQNVSHENLLIISLLIVLLIYILKAIFYAFITRLSLKITADLNINLTNNLYKSYLNETYDYHLNQNTSKLLRNILTEIHHFCNLISLLIQTLSDILIVAVITIMLLIVEPLIISVILAILFFISSSYYIFISKKVYNFGKQRQESDFLIIKYINESLSLIKEIIIYNLQSVFVDKHKQHYTNSTFANLNHNYLGLMVRPILETSAVIIFILLLLSIVISDKNFSFEQYIPFIAFLSASAFKLLPAINSITSNLGHIKFVMPSLDAVYSNLHYLSEKSLLNHNDLTEIKFDEVIEIKNLSYSYKGDGANVLRKLDFKIYKYDLFGITGNSGAGKTTLLNILMGLLDPSDGEILSDNLNIKESIKSWQKNISFVPQNIVLFDGSIKDNIILEIPYDEQRYNEIIEKAMLSEFINNLPNGENTLVGERGLKISGGERQRIAIARALYRKPQIIFLDEATNSLDSKTEDELIESILKLKNYVTFVIIAHNNRIKEICNNKIELKKL